MMTTARQGSRMYPRDVFISHAGPDKASHARPLVAALDRYGVSSWIDEGMLEPGDSLTENIGWGLNRAQLAVFLITSNFLMRQWPEKELNSALAREVSTGNTRVVIVIDGDTDSVIERYPLLADKLCINWKQGPRRIAQTLSHRFARKPDSWHMFQHPADYQGSVWVRVTPGHDGEPKPGEPEPYEMSLIWGPYRYSRQVAPPPGESISFTHKKIFPDSVPLYVNIVPEAIVTFGQGPSPDACQLNIDEGWVRINGASIGPPHDEHRRFVA